MNEIKQTLQQDADALLKRLQQSRKNGTGVTLAVSDVGVLCEEIEQLKAQLARVESGEYVVVPKDQLYQWGHMANYAQEYCCPECFEARGYAHNLACEINEYLKPVDAAQENSHE